MILPDKSNKIINHSSIRPADVLFNTSMQSNPLAVPKIVKSRNDISGNEAVSIAPSTIANIVN